MTQHSETEPDAAPGPGSARRFHAAAIAAIAIVTALLYANTLDVPFLFDDQPNIVEHPATHAERIDFASLERAATRSRGGARPVAYLSFALHHAIHGLEVRGYHVVNALIHAVNGVLVYLLGLFLLGRLAHLPAQRWKLRDRDVPWAALLAALLFVAHPVQTQAVTYVVQRMTSLSTSFYLATILLFVIGRESRSGSAERRTSVRPPIAWAFGILTFALALGTKQISAMLPVAILLVEWMFYRDASLAWLRRNWGWLAASALALGALAFLFLGARIVDATLEPYAIRDFTLAQRLLTQPRVVVFYLSLFAFPTPSRLSLFQHFEASNSLLDPPQTLLSLLILAGLIAFAILSNRSHRIVGFAIAWWFIHLAIESSFLALEMAYEHRIYLPSFGFFLAAGALPFAARAASGDARKRRAPVLAAAAVLLALLGAGTVLRNETWRDAIGFWSDVVAKSPADYRGHVNLGNHLLGEGRIEEAAEHIARGIQVAPESPFARYAAGVAWERAGRSADAERSFREAVARAPGFLPAHRALGRTLVARDRSAEAAKAFEAALRLDPNDPELLTLYAATLVRSGRASEAVLPLERALRIDPEAAGAQRERGVLALFSGRLDEAERDLLAALAREPDDAAANFYLANLREAQRREAEAIALLERALAANPELHEAANNLAWLLATAERSELRDPQRAIALAEAATRADGTDPGRLDTLAAAYAAAGRYPEAAKVARKAARLAREAGAQTLADEISARAANYRSERRSEAKPAQ